MNKSLTIKKLSFTVVAVMLTLLPLFANAQTDETAVEVTDKDRNEKAEDVAVAVAGFALQQVPGIKPTSSLYWLDIIFERIGIWFADDSNEEIAKLLEYADEKIAEVAELAANDPVEAAEASERYEKYIKEAVDVAEEAQDDGEDADVLLQDIATASLTHINAFVTIGSQAATLQQPYYEEAFETIEEQDKRVIEGIQDDAKRQQTVEGILDFLEKSRDSIPPEVQDSIRNTLESLISGLSKFIVEKGGPMLESLSESAKEFAKEKANEQLDRSRDDIIKTIEEFEF